MNKLTPKQIVSIVFWGCTGVLLIIFVIFCFLGKFNGLLMLSFIATLSLATLLSIKK